MFPSPGRLPAPGSCPPNFHHPVHLPQSILITGGAGFIGSNLALALRAALPDARVTCLDNLHRRGSELNLPRLAAAGIRFLQGDVRDPAALTAASFDLLIECCAEPSVLAGMDGSPDYLLHTNLIGAYHCLEACRRQNAGILFLSTSRVYPIAPLESHPWRETQTRFVWLDSPASPDIHSRGVSETLPINGARSLYGFTKLAAEQLIEEYRAAFGLRAIVNRCGVIAGPWQFGKVDQGVIAHWVMAHVFRRPLSYIGYGGAGKQVRDVLHIDDFCDLILEQVRDFDAWEGWNGNVAGGLENSISLLELTSLCRDITGSRPPITGIPQTRPNDLRLFIADCARLHARTDWRPSRSVRQTVADTHAWVCEHEAELRAVSQP